MDYTKIHRKRLGRLLLKKVEEAFAAEDINYNQSKQIADFILEHIDDVKSKESEHVFLQTLCQRWKFFSNVEQIENALEEEPF